MSPVEAKSALQRQAAVTAYFLSNQLLLFAFEGKPRGGWGISCHSNFTVLLHGLLLPVALLRL